MRESMRTLFQVRPAHHIVSALQAYAHLPCFLRPGYQLTLRPSETLQRRPPTRPRPHAARAGTAHIPTHATRDRPTRDRARRRPSGGARPPGTVQSPAQQHGAHLRAQSEHAGPPVAEPPPERRKHEPRPPPSRRHPRAPTRARPPPPATPFPTSTSSLSFASTVWRWTNLNAQIS